jgi:hypothetical protein
MPGDRSPNPAVADWLILLIGFTAAIAAALSLDREFMEHLPAFRSGPRSLGRVFPWAEPLELPARRVAFDFVGFLAVVSLALAVASFRRPSAWRPARFPAPGVAATAAAALGLIHQAAERLCLDYWNLPGERGVSLLWAGTEPPLWSPYDWVLGLGVLHGEAGVTGAVLRNRETIN